MTQATPVTAPSSSANLVASSTPIRISGTGSFHGAHTQTAATGNESSSPGISGPQSSSVPTTSGITVAHHAQHHHHPGQLQLQTTSGTQMGSSNQSLGGPGGAIAAGTSGGGGSGGGGGGGGSSSTPPNSAGLRQGVEKKLLRRTSLQILLPKLPSTDSLSNSPGPSSPGLANWATDKGDKYDGNQTDKTPTDTSKLNRKESYKAQRKNYRREKKRVASELLNSLQDPAVIVLADWLKVRGTLKSWTKLWCVLKPGLLLIYKSPKTKSSHWVGTVLLTSCQVIERPSKKDGFCFKLFHPLEQSIWAPRGPDKETIGAVVQPLPTAYLIFRAPSQAAGKCWMDALELSLRCSALLLRSSSNSGAVQGTNVADASQISHETQWSEADYEKHFNEHESNPAQPRYGELTKRHGQYLSVADADVSRSHGSSYYSIPSRSQTPVFQQLYTTMTNWERIVANTPEFQKIKNFRKLRKSIKSKDFIEGISSAADFSDVSSVDFSPKKCATTGASLRTSLIAKKRRLSQFAKSISMNSILNPSSSSDDCDDMDASDEVVAAAADASPPRSVSAPPKMAKEFMMTVKDLDADSQNEGATALLSGLDSDSDSEMGEGPEPVVEDAPETPYVPLMEEELGETGEQVEELAEENKSLIWCLVKQVRPGMDLSKVVLPTFILEPRSFLDKLSDSYYHADILSRAVVEDDPFTRMKLVVQWYLSGFYKKPKGLKKPYNPILGETFRCYWEHPNGSRTYYIAEQVSHHPPVSAFYVTNRQDGFCISCSILARSKFYGNSTSAVLEGVATLTLLPRGESYTLTTPYAHCKGILMGTLSMELGGKINIECENTGYKTEIEFKLKPFLGGSESTNVVAGKIKLGKETMAVISGHWDTEMRIKDAKTNEDSVLFVVNKETKQSRLMRYVVPIESQQPNESERLWQLVSAAIRRDDQVGATEEKTVLEEAQRTATKDRKAMCADWQTLHFQQDLITGQWLYKYADLRPWDPRNDLKQYESEYKVLTKTRHQAPMVRTASIVSGDPIHVIRADSRQSAAVLKAKRIKNKSIVQMANNSDSSQSNDELIKKPISSKSIRQLAIAIDQVNKALDDHTRQLALIHSKLERIQYAPLTQPVASMSSQSLILNLLPRSIPQSTAIKCVVYTMIGILLSVFFKWLCK